MLFFARLYGVQGRLGCPADSQDNPRSSSSDGVPPELEVLGFHVFLRLTGLTGWKERSDWLEGAI